MSSLSIVIVTFNSKELLRDLLLSIRADTSLGCLLRDVVVVDNGSEDGTERMVREEFQECLVFREEENKGFAYAANRGAELARGDYILFLNSDTILLPGQVKKMVELMAQEASIGILGPSLISPEGKPQRSYALLPSLLFEFIPKSLFEKKVLHGLSDVESIVGAAMLVRRKVFEELSGFDEGFFFFLEETDLCLRARKKGHRVVCFPLARVTHLQGATVRRRWVQGRIEYNLSLYHFIRKHHGSLYFAVFASVRFIKALLFLAFLSPFSLLLRKAGKDPYMYHAKLLLWHLLGCPKHWGLRSR